MSKLISKLKSMFRSENPYKAMSTTELEQRREELRKQRKFCSESMIVRERGYSARGYEGSVSEPREDVFYMQLRSIDREINRIDAELSRRKDEQVCSTQQERE